MKYLSPLKLTIYGGKSTGCIAMAAVRETAEKFGKENTQQIGCIGDAQGHGGDNRSERFLFYILNMFILKKHLYNQTYDIHLLRSKLLLPLIIHSWFLENS
jgi:hypothetical protein